MNALDRIAELLQGRDALVALAALAALAVLFLALWLRARGGGGSAAKRDELRVAQRELKLVRGDLIQAKHDHAAELGRLNRELDNLRAVAGGRMPPELEEWRRRAQAAEARLETERAEVEARYRARVEELEKEAGASLGRTVITPNVHALQEQARILQQELVEARRQLEAVEGRHQVELKDLAERLEAEKAAALTALAERARAKPADGPGPVDAGALEEGNVPHGLKLPFLEPVDGGPEGARRYLPYGQTTIGRHASNTLVVKEPGEQPRASRFHAEVDFDGVDFVLRDRKSQNGTFVNGDAVESARLALGDVVGIGDLRFRFGCAAHDLAESDAAAAAEAYRAMLAVAPRFRAALAGLTSLLEHDEASRDEATGLKERLSALDPVA